MLSINTIFKVMCMKSLSIDRASCLFVIGWETRLACAVKQREVEMVNGTIQNPNTGAPLSLGELYFR